MSSTSLGGKGRDVEPISRRRARAHCRVAQQRGLILLGLAQDWEYGNGATLSRKFCLSAVTVHSSSANPPGSRVVVINFDLLIATHFSINQHVNYDDTSPYIFHPRHISRL